MKEDAPKSGIIMLIVLVVIYIISLGLAVYLAAHGAFNEKENPFVTALDKYHFSFFPHVFNATIILAGFSTMTVSLFGVTTLLVTLADGDDAPALFSKKLKKFKEFPLPSFCLATIGLSIYCPCVAVTAAGILIFVQLVFHYYFCSSYLKNKN